MESFHHMTRLGDVFLENLAKTGEDMSKMFAFSELIEKIDENKGEKSLPIDWYSLIPLISQLLIGDAFLFNLFLVANLK